LRLFKKLEINIDTIENKNIIIPLVLNNMKKLNEITLWGNAEESFVHDLLQNSHETLKYLFLQRLFYIPDITFPQLAEFQLSTSEEHTLLPEFQNCFPKILKHTPCLETVRLYECDSISITQYALNNYESHCMSVQQWGLAPNNPVRNAPVKILTGIHNLQNMLTTNHDNKYLSHVEYAHVFILSLHPMDNGWDIYRDVFDQFRNLKAIELERPSGKNFIKDYLPTLSEEHQNIWKERISYFEARGICIAHLKEIRDNASLRAKVAKEAGVPWIFHFL